MIRINQLKIDIDKTSDSINKYIDLEIKRLLKVKNYNSFNIIKKSIDARKKPKLYYVFTIDVDVSDEVKVLNRSKCKQASICSEKKYIWPEGNIGNKRPVVVGMGPAGLFCGYMLAKAGLKPHIYERGKNVDERTDDVLRFWESGELDICSNVQFGEGGAGTFSDGKLNTLVNDKTGRNKEVLKILVEHGAPKEILIDSKPHVGTDILRKVVRNIREEIIALGGIVHFETKLIDIIPNDNNVIAVFDDGSKITTDALVLAIGHSARDTFEMLNDKKLPMEPKAFAVGFRVQHPQEMIDKAMYGTDNANKGLPPSSYKLTYHTDDNTRGVYSFCMCPGGYVVNASSEKGHLAINGMSYSGRDSKVANSAIIISVDTKDYKGNDPLAGVRFQREIEHRAYELGNGKIPYESYHAFKNRLDDDDIKDLNFRFKGECINAPVHNILPEELNVAFVEGMESFGKVIDGYSFDQAVIAGIESRTSSPVRINRDINHESLVKGIYPCGEGAGYAGGIMSAAMDGILIAEEIWKR